MNKFDFNDILIKPSAKSNILTRKEINPFINGFLPLFTAPMDSVIDFDNLFLYNSLKVRTCTSRDVQFNPLGFTSISLPQFKDIIIKNKPLILNTSILVDIANGHMKSLHDLVYKFKKLYPHITLMVGNVANPETYVILSNAGADYIRVGIGNGGGCSTTVHTGVGYPMGSLIQECYTVSSTLNSPAKIVADGGMQNYSDIIKALALGADYVMVGSLFNKALESSGDNYLWGKIMVPQCVANVAYKFGIPLYKKFRGMSTKEVQKKWGNKKLTSSEGVTRFRRVDYSLKQWVENFEDYLRSAMSYANAKDLNQFINNTDIIKITNNAYNRYKK